MTDMKNYKDLIDKYLDGELEGDKLQIFEKMMEEDSEFLREVDFQKEVREAIAEEDVLELREKLQRIAESDQEKCRTIPGKKIVYTMAAAVIGIVLMAGTWLLLKQFNPDPSELYAQYYSPYENVYSIRSAVTQNTMEEPATKAFRNYNKNDWTEAEKYFASAINNNPGNISYLFYAGIVKLELNKTEEALHHFKKVIQEEEGLFTQQAYWYISLAYLKSGNTDKAESYLNFIVDHEMIRKEEAESLLDKILSD